MNKIDMREITEDELNEYLRVIGSEAYRAKQVLDWIYNKKIKSIEEMTNLSKKLREDLQNEFYVSGLILLQEMV
ncbi:MAG: 23S rRNA (adenine(2503)-C(2))-methyltransferase RlmN, partial [Nitrospinae bacterium]|nr:23S rRNA (adenine(2503)-C(2))-methyltransferase RlmN [Nitrospinota bacterium]